MDEPEEHHAHKGAFSLAKRLGSALLEWQKGGRPVVSKETMKKRLTICRDCEWWSELGKSKWAMCKACGCTSLKLLMGTSQCPLNPPRWKKEIEEIEEPPLPEGF
ncbi:hypothetical protein CMO96_03775 [Candidatus Woesebacteria bacterium]|nr:hypothetical protein [Candidatus Woesebacteria bacterium]